ncbi:efflux RND transporter periplasmic adaptor subunit [Shewanella sp. YIC-542]|uniref:efflux RND transporter periplasmic adaptor subunit n=1 Tax=Shewanella mytili TaxID=3377111 RepID=UPI00398E505B
MRGLLLTTLMVGLGLLTSPTLKAATKDVATVTVVSQKAPHMLVLDGTLEAVKSATVSAQTSGRIVKLNFDVNDLVPAGAPLLEITSKEQGAELAAAEAGYARAQALNVEAQKTLARYQTLFPQGAISKGAMDQAVANAKSAQQAASAALAQITKARESLKYTVVSAPYAGVVTARHVEVGEAVAPGQPLLSGFATGKMRAVIEVPQRYREALIKAGAVDVSLSDGRKFHVTEPVIFGFTDTQSHAYKVRLPLPENTPALLPGSWIKARFPVAEREITFIPLSALYSVNELSGVYLQQGDHFILQQVRLGATRGDEVEVQAGLSAGDVIAANAYQVLLSHPVQQ